MENGLNETNCAFKTQDVPMFRLIKLLKCIYSSWKQTMIRFKVKLWKWKHFKAHTQDTKK